MSRLTSDESFKQLIYIAQQYLNKLLTPTDCQILGNLYSNLGFSGELLEYLIEYCVQNHHTSLRYMERWHSAGISAASRMWNRQSERQRLHEGFIRGYAGDGAFGPEPGGGRE